MQIKKLIFYSTCSKEIFPEKTESSPLYLHKNFNYNQMNEFIYNIHISFFKLKMSFSNNKGTEKNVSFFAIIGKQSQNEIKSLKK